MRRLRVLQPQLEGAHFGHLRVQRHRHHLPGAVNLPHAKIVEYTLRPFAADAAFVVYCAGPHCNGAQRAAIRLARLGRPVKLMLGGVTGWLDEGFALETGVAAEVAS